MVPSFIHSGLNNKFSILVKSCSNAKFLFTTITFAPLFKWNSVVTEFRLTFGGMTRPTLVHFFFSFSFSKNRFRRFFYFLLIFFFVAVALTLFTEPMGIKLIFFIKTIRGNVFFLRQM